jgi:hypothetical protein
VLLDDPSAFDVSELAGLEATGAEPEAGFVPMVDGLAITDPLQPYAGSMPAELLEWFVSLGAEGATELSPLTALETVETCAGVTHTPEDLLQATLRTQLHEIEGVVSSGGAVLPSYSGADVFGSRRCTRFKRPAGPWSPVGPGIADPAGKCWYQRPREEVEICCSRTATGCACTTTINPLTPQRGSCPGYEPGANCHATPRCVIPWDPNLP